MQGRTPSFFVFPETVCVRRTGAFPETLSGKDAGAGRFGAECPRCLSLRLAEPQDGAGLSRPASRFAARSGGEGSRPESCMSVARVFRLPNPGR